ncbi:hypothetical protein HAX54_017196 [Datura stramonium]|uniref:Uncharacterized protein n=1 Tax=Datura stramonium TaxID=4076 RepID=A0ABS8S0E3_DATST|nr:hypothetical protein [Datura stramonium]
MAGFFLIGGEGEGREETSSQEYRHHQETTSTHNLFMYKNHVQELPTYKGFELLQQQNHDDHEQSYRNPIINPFELDIGPNHHHHEDGPNNNSRSAGNFMMMMMRSSSSRITSNNSSTISCQDCGNQAKKDCQHMRCRTCCKNRGFQCQTHVKSTWVPAAKRRERQQQQQQQQQQDHSKPKRQKDDPIITGSSDLVCTHLPSFNIINIV